MATLKIFITELEAQNVNNLDFLIIHQSDLSTQEIEQSTGGIHCGKISLTIQDQQFKNNVSQVS